MDFKQIEAFVNVVRFKSFSKAADASFFSQPTISTHIQNLEKELGVKLLDRKSRTVEPTSQGNAFYKYAVEMLNARARAVDAISSATDSLSGVLEIQSSSVPSVSFLPELMAEFKESNEGIQYYLSVSDTQNVIDNILDRRGEIGFIGEEIKNPAIKSELVFKDKSVLIAPPTYKIGKNISLADSFRYPFIWRESGSATRANFEKAVAKAGLDTAELKLAALVDDIDAIVRNVEAGLGVSIISEKVAASLEGRVKVARIKDFDEKRSFYMIHLKNSSLSPAAVAFAEFVNSKSL